MPQRLTSTVQANQLLNQLAPFGVTKFQVEQMFADVIKRHSENLPVIMRHDEIMGTNESEAAVLALKNAIHNHAVIRNL